MTILRRIVTYYNIVSDRLIHPPLRNSFDTPYFSTTFSPLNKFRRFSYLRYTTAISTRIIRKQQQQRRTHTKLLIQQVNLETFTVYENIHTLKNKWRNIDWHMCEKKKTKTLLAATSGFQQRGMRKRVASFLQVLFSSVWCFPISSSNNNAYVVSCQKY